MKNKEYNKSGYLHQNFRLFHLKDKKNMEFDFHYHDFNKIIIFLSGNVTYFIEGKAYFLKPYDVLLVGHHNMHKPVIDADSTYERIVIWINNDFIRSERLTGTDISACFAAANERSLNLIRLNAHLQNKIQDILGSLENTLTSDAFGSDILSNTYFLQLMVYLNRVFLDTDYELDHTSLKYDKRIETILKYINLHLTEDLTIETLSAMHYLSPSYLMHTFKQETGYSVHQYVTQKRLLLANELILNDVPVTKAAIQSGFHDYSVFSRAFKKMYGISPREYRTSPAARRL